MKKASTLDKLFDKFLNRTCTADELRQLFEYFQTSDENILRKLIEAEITRPDNDGDLLSERQKQQLERVHQNIKIQLSRKPQVFTTFRRILPYAAAILLFIGVGIFYYMHTQEVDERIQLSSKYGDDVEPGGNKATVTLSDGTVVELSEQQTEIVVSQTGLRYSDGQEVIETSKEVTYATLATPRGGQYQLTLPDGTKLWLNAASSVRYPTTFTGKERRVTLQGEGYFEVKENKEQAFIVETTQQHLKVLGTSFNINAYPNESATVTTLLSGSVELHSKENKVSDKLKPEQQAILNSKGFLVNTIDVHPFIAWKDGEFRFKETPLHEAIRQIERWYDLEVDYSQIPSDIEIYAYIRRDKKLSSVLVALEKITHLKFEVKERRLMIKE